MQEQNQQQIPQSEKLKKKFYKKWWFWVIVAVLIVIVVLLIPFDCQNAQCVPCETPDNCSPCPKVCNNLWDKLRGFENVP